MGKNYPRVTTIKENRALLPKAIALIEKSFQYKKPNRFAEDFAPLIAENNLNHCYVLIDENENVLAHIGAKLKHFDINGNKHTVFLLGGIAVDEAARGQGHFQTLMLEVLSELRSDASLFILWSDLEKLYRKFGFYLCGNQFEVPYVKGEGNYQKTKYSLISQEEKSQIHRLYSESFGKTYFAPDRSQGEWSEIEQIVSADLFVRKDKNQITDYFFMNKGQDLAGVVYEYGSSRGPAEVVRDAHHYGKVWTGLPLVETEQLQFQFFMSPGDLKLFSAFISDLTGNKVHVVNINLMKEEVFFNFNGETLVLEVEEFLQGIFGPGSFEELDLDERPLFISGLDSV